jgi:uncharacterized protein with von Willebrand factor type A (vWA) domain
MAKKHLTPEERAKLEKLGWDKLMEQFRKRLAEQKERHPGGSKWIGTGGSSPFGHGGYHPEGIRIGGDSAGNRTAVKVWDKREFRNLDDSVELGTRNIKVALRRLRRFARQGAADRARSRRHHRRHRAQRRLARPALRPSATTRSRCCSSSTSAARWTTTSRSARSCSPPAGSSSSTSNTSTSTTASTKACGRTTGAATRAHVRLDVIHKYGPDYKLIFVGDATMSPYEILQPARLGRAHERRGRRHLAAPPARRLAGGRMFPLTLDGLERGMRLLSK